MKASGFVMAVLVITLITACEENIKVDTATAEVTMLFDHLVDGNKVQLDNLIYKNALNQDYSIKTIKYFISGVRFHRLDQQSVELNDIHFVDIRDTESLSYVFEQKIPQGAYTGISFVYGLSPEDNTSGRFTQPPESLMEWPEPMGGGYHYMKIEGEYLVKGSPGFFNFHAGMLDGVPYEIHIDLPNSAFAVSDNTFHLTLNMEIQHWFQNPTDWDFEYFGGAIMGNHEAQKTIQENGVDVFTVGISDGAL